MYIFKFFNSNSDKGERLRHIGCEVITPRRVKEARNYKLIKTLKP